MFTPTSITVAPGFTNCFVTSPAMPAAATRMSASRQTAGEIRCLRMTDRDCRVTLEQQQCHWFADDLTAADHARPAAGQRDRFPDQKLDDPRRSAGHERGPALHQQADIARCQAIDVLLRRDRVEDTRSGARAQAFRQRRLHEDAVVDVAAVKPFDEREHIGERGGFRQPFEIRPETDITACLQLVANVHFRRRILTDQDDGEPGRTPLCGTNAATFGVISSWIRLASAAPSSNRALIAPPF